MFNYSWTINISPNSNATTGTAISLSSQSGISAFPTVFYSCIPTILSFTDSNGLTGTGSLRISRLQINTVIRTTNTFDIYIENNNSDVTIASLNINFVAIGN
jgi:hypothetical protein